MGTRTDGERTRLVHSVQRLRSILIGIETALKVGGPVGLEASEACVHSALEIALQLAKLDAYDLAEHDARNGKED